MEWGKNVSGLNLFDNATLLLGVNVQNQTAEATCSINSTETVDENYCVACIIVPILLTTCIIAMCVNVIVIASVFWIRSPMTPNLKISLSLAAADACSSSMYGMLIFVESYVESDLGVFPYVVEILRLSGIVITVVHLLALSLNHYIGILKPLHYNSIVTSRKVSTTIVLLWLCPTLTVIAMCFAFDADGTLLYNFEHNTSLPPRFMNAFAFRMTFSSLFFVPIATMVVCYTHILLVVKKQQNKWNNISRLGSTKVRGSQKVCKEKKQLEGNVRAIHTTLFILGSCFLGWTPALLFYTLACQEGCFVQGKDVDNLNCNYRTIVMIVRLMDNILVILKMLANPIIYSIRMKEIKDGTHRMYSAILGIFCLSRRDGAATSGYYYRSRNRNSTIQLRLSSLRSLHRNGIQIDSGRDINSTFL